MQLLLLLLIIFLPKASSHLIVPATNNSISERACDLTKHILNNSKELKDVLILNVGGEIWKSTINDVTRCAANNQAPVTVIQSLNSPAADQYLRQSAVVIMAYDRNEMVSIISNSN